MVGQMMANSMDCPIREQYYSLVGRPTRKCKGVPLPKDPGDYELGFVTGCDRGGWAAGSRVIAETLLRLTAFGSQIIIAHG